MSDEFDDAIDVAVRHHGPQRPDEPAATARPSVARLMWRLYATAKAPLRARMLTVLLQPLGPLGLVAIAAGAFGSLLHRGRSNGLQIGLEDVGRYTGDQIVELTRFVEQVSPDALQQAASLVADSPAGVTAFSVSVALLLLRALQAGSSADRGTPQGSADPPPSSGQV